MLDDTHMEQGAAASSSSLLRAGTLPGLPGLSHRASAPAPRPGRTHALPSSSHMHKRPPPQRLRPAASFSAAAEQRHYYLLRPAVYTGAATTTLHTCLRLPQPNPQRPQLPAATG